MKNSSTLIAFALTGSLLATGVALGQVKWPIVFRNSDEMRPLGLILVGFGNEPLERKITMFPHNCYSYGDGGNSISFSDEFFASFRSKGFSVNSLCLALQSPIAFDPATGRRVPSYQVAHPRIIAGRPAQDAGELSEVLPIAPPDCFKRGLPYHDCTFDHDVATGRRLSEAKKKALSKVRADLDELIEKQRAANGLRRECKDVEASQVANCRKGVEEMTSAGGREATQPYLALKGADVEIPESVSKAGVTLIDFSTVLPLGYGYQLRTDGTAGPEGGDPALARDSSRRASEEKIKAIRRTISGQ